VRRARTSAEGRFASTARHSLVGRRLITPARPRMEEGRASEASAAAPG